MQGHASHKNAELRVWISRGVPVQGAAGFSDYSNNKARPRKGLPSADRYTRFPVSCQRVRSSAALGDTVGARPTSAYASRWRIGGA